MANLASQFAKTGRSTLAGTGSVGATTVTGGGTLAAGNGTAGSSLNIAGSLALQSGAFYVVQINPATTSFANVTGLATLNGAVSATFTHPDRKGRSQRQLRQLGQYQPAAKLPHHAKL